MTNSDKYKITYFDYKTGEAREATYSGTKEECYKQFKEQFPDYSKQRVVIDKVS